MLCSYNIAVYMDVMIASKHFKNCIFMDNKLTIKTKITSLENLHVHGFIVFCMGQSQGRRNRSGQSGQGLTSFGNLILMFFLK